MITKDKVIELVEHMPDTFSIDNLVERVLILEKIEKRNRKLKTAREWIGKISKKRWTNGDFSTNHLYPENS